LHAINMCHINVAFYCMFIAPDLGILGRFTEKYSL
jgi:hypothetical protein